MLRKLTFIGSIVALIAIAALAWGGITIHGSRGRAERMIVQAQQQNLPDLWHYARVELERYLWLFPNDAEARLLIAETLIKDETLNHEKAVQQALDHLKSVPDDDEKGAEARTKEGKLYLLMVHKLGRAEAALRKALDLDPENREANYLIWKSMELTGRADRTGEFFWRAYDWEEEGGRPPLLRNYYMTQFFPFMNNQQLERQMGLLGPGERPTSDNEWKRFEYFRKVEPDWPVCHAALAKWFLDDGDPKFTKRILDEAKEKVGDQDEELSRERRTLNDASKYEKERATRARADAAIHMVEK